MSDTNKWALGIAFSTLFALILGTYSYASRIEDSVEQRARQVEARLTERLDRIELKLDALLWESRGGPKK